MDFTGSDLASCDRIVWMHRHFPTTDLKAVEFWALGITDGAPSTATLAYKTTTWTTVAMDDAMTLDGVNEYLVQGLSLHGKLFLAYNSAVDRLHVWDGTSLRRTGLAEPAAPTGANTGAGTFAGTRYYRVRYTAQASGVTVRRSEPSDVLTFVPSGSGSAARITKPATISEGETHWELEASVDNANFYRIATTVVGTTTADDDQDFDTGYAQDFTLSEDIGDYALVPSGRYLAVDGDRLLIGGSFETAALASRVMWTPVYGADGVGNDERLETDTDPFVDLDNYDGGPLTGLSNNVNGYNYGFKQSHVYQLARTGVRTRAYESIPLTKQRGAIPGSIVEGFNATGTPTLFCLDPDVGPCLIATEDGVVPCGRDLINTWETVNLDATKVVSRAVYFPEQKQVQWWVATGSANVPDLRLVLQTNEMRMTADGARRGWAVWNGPSAAALAVVMFSSNIDDDTDRSNDLVPYIALEGAGLVWRTNTTDADNGTAYAARIVSKPFVLGSLMHQFEVRGCTFMTKAATGVTVDVTVIGNFGLFELEAAGISLTPSGTEERVILQLDDLGLAELNAMQVEFEDAATPTGRWQLEQAFFKVVPGQRL